MLMKVVVSVLMFSWWSMKYLVQSGVSVMGLVTLHHSGPGPLPASCPTFPHTQAHHTTQAFPCHVSST